MGSTVNPRTFFAFGLNHKTAPVELREKLYVDEGEIPAFLRLLRETLSECVVLSTCNRTEVYAVSDRGNIDLDHYKNLLIKFKETESIDDAHFFSLISCTATQQLFSVATSIDSRIVGDSQILRQLRSAYSIATEYGSTGKILNQLFQRAFKIGKQTYTRTSIHDGAVSASLAAAELAVEQFGSLRTKTALIVGAGEMATQTAEALINRKIEKLLITNRTRAHADVMKQGLQDNFGFESRIVDFECLKGSLPEADIVVSSTGSEEPILFAEDFARQTRPTLVLDIAVPRDVDDSVADCENVILKNIDDLNLVVGATHEKRLNDLPKVHEIIRNEMVDFLTWYYTLPLLPEYEKTGLKPSVEQTREVLRIKEFLALNVDEIHHLYASLQGNFTDDLASHFALIERLQTMKQRAFAAGV